MSLHFHPLTVKEVRRETNDCVSIAFDIPPALEETFAYQHGQYVTLRTFINKEEIRRSYSLCSSPLEKEWRVAVRKVEEGIFSAYANEQLKAGDVLEVMPPIGKFTSTLNATHKKDYVGIAAGSGITPVLSIIKTLLQAEPFSSFTLVYGNRSKNSIIFKEELEALKNKYISRFRVIHVLSRERTDAPINFGRIDAGKCDALFGKLVNIDADAFFICGPEEMIHTVTAFLEQKQVDRKKIHFELFTTAGQKSKASNKKKEGDSGPQCKVTVRLDGRSLDFSLPFNSSNILDAALQQGLDLPYACKGGVCCTCRAKLVEGEVDMEVNYGLEPEEVMQGFILTCQSQPVTERVVVDFDVK